MITQTIGNASAGNLTSQVAIEGNTVLRQLVIPKSWLVSHSVERDGGFGTFTQSNDSLGDPIVAGNYLSVVLTADSDGSFYGEATCEEIEVA